MKENYNVISKELKSGWKWELRYKNEFGKWCYGGSGSGYSTEKKALAAGELFAQDFNPLDATIKALTLRRAFAEKCDYNGIKESTKDMNVKVMKWFEEIMDTDVSEITPIMIKKCIHDDAALATKKMYLSIVSSVFNYCIEIRDMSIKNPCKKITFRANSSDVKKQPTLISQADIKKLYRLIQKRSKNKALLFYTMAFTGMRISEALGLHSSDIDYDKNEITVSKQRYKKYGISKDTKSNRGDRKIPLSKTLKAELKKHQRIGLLFDRVEPGGMIRIYESLGFQITNHSLRHTFTTRLIEGGLSYKRVAQIIGDTEETIIKTYSHSTDQMIEKSEKYIHNL